ncbi:histamine H2 receptor-like [Arapaima gigas]
MIFLNLFYMVVMMATSMGSVGGNMTLLLVVALNKTLQTETWAFTLSFCLCDLALGLTTMPFTVHNILNQVQEYGTSSVLCQANGFLFVLLQLASVHSQTWTIIDKFTEICFALQYPRIFNKKRTWAVLVSLWLYCLVSAALPLLGFGSYRYSRTRFICVPSFQSSSRGFNLLFIVLGIIAPILIMCSLYAYLVHIARNQVLRGTFVCNEQHCYYVPAKNYFKTSMVMVATIACLLVCWLPYITTCFYETYTGQNSPAVTNAVATWLVFFTSALNPWIISMTQKYDKHIQNINKMKYDNI